MRQGGLSKLLSKTLRDKTKLRAYVMMACYMYEEVAKCDSDPKICIR